jgi:hypothetical protein
MDNSKIATCRHHQMLIRVMHPKQREKDMLKQQMEVMELGLDREEIKQVS